MPQERDRTKENQTPQGVKLSVTEKNPPVKRSVGWVTILKDRVLPKKESDIPGCRRPKPGKMQKCTALLSEGAA